MLRERAGLLSLLRNFFAARDVLEVQTPLLGRFSVTDPAIRAIEAEQSYLQTSTEYHQKRLLAAGIPDNYTLGPVFRGGESGGLHNPEFTMLEWYRCGFDEQALMSEVAELVDAVLESAEYRYVSGAEIFAAARSEHRRLQAAGTLPRLAADVLDSWCMDEAYRQLGPGRVFVTNFPANQALLAQLDPNNPKIARRFELLIDGVELVNGYFELVDPVELAKRFERDNRQRIAAGDAAQTIDINLLAALEHGLPSCAGVALGVDRLLMLKLGLTDIDQVQTFSWQRR